MPIQIKYLDNGIGVSFIGEGLVTGDDIISANHEVFSSEERMKNLKYGFIDYSYVSHFNVSNSDIESMAYQQKETTEFIADGVVAFVAKKDLEFGLVRMWETIAEITGVQWETMVFRDKKKAEIWIKDKVKQKYDVHISIK